MAAMCPRQNTNNAYIYPSAQMLLIELEKYKQSFTSLSQIMNRKRKYGYYKSYSQTAIQSPTKKRKMCVIDEVKEEKIRIPMDHHIDYTKIESEQKSDCCKYLEKNIRFEQLDNFMKYQSELQKLNKDLKTKSKDKLFPFKIINYIKKNAKQIIHLKYVGTASKTIKRYVINDKILMFCSCFMEHNNDDNMEHKMVESLQRNNQIMGGKIIDINLLEKVYIIRITKYSSSLSEYQYLETQNIIDSAFRTLQIAWPTEITNVIIQLLGIKRERKHKYHNQKECLCRLDKDEFLFHTFRSQLKGIETFFSITSNKMHHRWFWKYYYRPNLSKILNPTQQIQYQKERSKVEQFFAGSQWTLNASQLTAIAIASLEDICLIQGPPGTGKTTTGINIVRYILQNNRRDYRIIIAAHTNAACDQLLTEIDKDANLASKTVRFANPSQIQRKELKKYSYRKYMEQHELHKRMKALFSGYASAQYTREQTKEHARELEAVIIKDVLYLHNIIITTCYGASQNVFVDNSINIDAILFDESTQILEPEAIILFNLLVNKNSSDCDVHGKNSKKKLIMIGDPKQLSPVVSSDDAKMCGYGISYFERLLTQTSIKELMECDNAREVVRNNAKQSKLSELHSFVMLNVQYRSYDILMQFSSEHFYNNKIKHFQKWEGQINGLIGGIDWRNNKPLNMIAINGAQYRKQTSWSNFKEAQCIIRIIENIIEFGQNENVEGKIMLNHFNQIGIITPFTAQRDLIKRELRKLNHKYEMQCSDIEVATVDQFQGQQKHLILYSLVRTDIVATDFMKDTKRVNVALSRAKFGFILIGHIQQLSVSSIWMDLREYFATLDAIRYGKI